MKNIELDLTRKVDRYFLYRMKGLNKSQAEREAGYASPHTNSSHIEETKRFQELKEAFKDNAMTLQDVIAEHSKNIKQDSDKGAKNKAIEMYYKLMDIFPKGEGQFDTGDFSVTIKKK